MHLFGEAADDFWSICVQRLEQVLNERDSCQ
jgi:hypothetical protein